MKIKLVLENGQEFIGESFGSSKTQIGEICVNTSMVGYQDILSDPIYFNKIVCMTYPLIGNYGLADEDYDFKNIYVKGYVVKENNDFPSNFRSTRILSEVMEETHISGVSDVDTRQISKIIARNGVMKAMICDALTPKDTCLKLLNEYKMENPLPVVSCKKIWYSRTANPSHSVVIVDLGVKTSLVKKINEYGLNVIVVPYNSTLEQIKKLKPNGIIISSGPECLSYCEEVINLIKDLKGKYPILALGQGACVLAKAYNLTVNKMKHPHLGANLPVRNLLTNTIQITSQNHFYEIKDVNNKEITITHVNVLNNDIEGFVDNKNKVIATLFAIYDDDSIMKNFIENMNK